METLPYGTFGAVKTRFLPSYLPKAIRQVYAGEAWIPRALAGKILDRVMLLESLP
jgi:hypothetical protein